MRIKSVEKNSSLKKAQWPTENSADTSLTFKNQFLKTVRLRRG